MEFDKQEDPTPETEAELFYFNKVVQYKLLVRVLHFQIGQMKSLIDELEYVFQKEVQNDFSDRWNELETLQKRVFKTTIMHYEDYRVRERRKELLTVVEKLMEKHRLLHSKKVEMFGDVNIPRYLRTKANNVKS